MGVVITQGVAMCNPAHMTQEQLVEQVNRLQADCLQQGMALHKMNCVAHSQTEALKHLVDAHEQGDHQAIADKLQELSDWRKQFTQQRPVPH